MPVIKPFKAVRPKQELAEKVASLPYDVISEKEARDAFNQNPYSFFQIGRPEINFEEGVDPYSEKVYQKAQEVIQELLLKNILEKEDSESLYIYAQSVNQKTQIGLVCLSSVEDYDKNIIKKHELTREIKEKDRFNHILKSKCHAEPVFLAYRDLDKINKIINDFMSKNSPLYDFTSEDKVTNTLWRISDTKILNDLQALFKNDINALYIADGHHRAKASSLVGNYLKEQNKNHSGDESYNFFLTVLFPSSQLNILPYNRAIKSKITIQEIIEKSSELFDVSETEMTDVEKKGEFKIYNQGKAYLFRYKGPKLNDIEKSLDVALLQNYILDPILGIKNPRKDENIDFIGGIKGVKYLKNLVDNGEFDLSIAMYPTAIEELFQISDEDKIMPPKSTWFEPKLKSGLFLHLIEE